MDKLKQEAVEVFQKH
jgi:DnaJ family protein C protein 7